MFVSCAQCHFTRMQFKVRTTDEHVSKCIAAHNPTHRHTTMGDAGATPKSRLHIISGEHTNERTNERTSNKKLIITNGKVLFGFCSSGVFVIVVLCRRRRRRQRFVRPIAVTMRCAWNLRQGQKPWLYLLKINFRSILSTVRVKLSTCLCKLRVTDVSCVGRSISPFLC